MKIAWMLAASLLLGGCEATSFERAPLAEGACDARLPGHWDSIGDKPDEDGDVQLDIGPDCRLELFDRHEGAMRAGAPTQLHFGTQGGKSYVWFDAGWSLRRFDSDLTPPSGDVLLMRYALSADQLTVVATDDKAIAHQVLDERIPGTVRKDDDGLQVRITGGPHPALLDGQGFFKDEPMRFRRGAEPSRHE